MKIRLPLILSTLVIISLLLAACYLPTTSSPGMSIDMIYPHTSTTIWPLGITPGSLNALAHVSAGADRIVFYANGTEIGATTALKPAPDANNLAGGITWDTNKISAGEYYLQAEVQKGSSSARSAPVRVCVVNAVSMFFSGYGFSGPCPVSASAPPPGFMYNNTTVKVVPESMAYSYKCSTTPAPAILTFTATVKDPTDVVKYANIDYEIDGLITYDTVLLTYTGSPSTGVKTFSGSTVDLSPFISPVSVGAPGKVNWYFYAFNAKMDVISDSPWGSLPTAACTAPVVYTVSHAPLPSIIAPDTSSSQAIPLPTNTPTVTPTVVLPTATMEPTVTIAGPFFSNIQVNPKVFNHRNANKATCSPNQLDLKLQVAAPQSVASVLLFYRLTSSQSSTDWNNGILMTPLGNGSYETKLPADAVPGAQGFLSATFKYQFVAFNSQQNVLSRSPVYTDVTLGTCP